MFVNKYFRYSCHSDGRSNHTTDFELPLRCFFLPVIPSLLCKKWKFMEINDLLLLELSARNRFQVKSGNYGNCQFARLN